MSIDVGQFASTEASYQSWIPSDVAINVVEIDLLASDGELGGFALGVSFRLDDEDGQDLVALELLVEPPLPYSAKSTRMSTSSLAE